MKYIKLTRGQWARVSDMDYEELNQYKWHAHWNIRGRIYYADRHAALEANGNHPHISMHRQIMGALPGQQVDHIDHDGLHNERENLRTCSAVQNSGNARKHLDGLTSQYKGVCWKAHCRRWYATIRINGIGYHLGSFIDETDAARAYNVAALKKWGVFALLNQVS